MSTLHQAVEFLPAKQDLDRSSTLDMAKAVIANRFVSLVIELSTAISVNAQDPLSATVYRLLPELVRVIV